MKPVIQGPRSVWWALVLLAAAQVGLGLSALLVGTVPWLLLAHSPR
jgi:hypothetical protein